MSAEEKLNQVLAEVQEQFPGAELEDLRQGESDAAGAGTAPSLQLRPVQETTLGRMKAAAIAEATRIEMAQARLVEGGQIDVPSEAQLALRDAFDGLARLVELIEGDKPLQAMIRQKRKPVG